MSRPGLAAGAPAAFWSLEWWRGVATPGPGGYALAVLLSAPAFGVLSAGWLALQEGDSGLLLSWLGISFYALMLCLPVAVPGVLVVHLVCRRARSQWVHVVVAGLVGAVAGVVVSGTLGDVGWGGMGWQLGLATAAGRASVIPLVPGARTD